MLNNSSLGEKIVDARRAKALTQAELADMAGISRASISLYESGNGHPSYKVLGKLSQILGPIFAQEAEVPSDNSYGEPSAATQITDNTSPELQLIREVMNAQQAEIGHLKNQVNRLEAQIELLVKMVSDSRK